MRQLEKEVQPRSWEEDLEPEYVPELGEESLFTEVGRPRVQYCGQVCRMRTEQ